jgi:multiple sugar transport system substrate-binding protein
MCKKTKKILWLISIMLCITAMALTSFAAEGKTVIVPSWWAPHEIAGAEKAFNEKFTPETGITVKYEFIAPGDNHADFHTKMLSTIAAKQPYDVMTFNHNELVRYAEKGLLEPLDPLIKADNLDIKDFYPEVIKMWTYKGHIYGLSNDQATFHLYINKDLFKKAGVKIPTGSWTWVEFLNAAKKLTVRDKSGNVTQWGFGNSVTWQQNLWPNLNGAQLWAKDMSKSNYDDPAVIQAVQFQVDLYRKYKVQPAPEGMVNVNYDDMFAEGKLAIYLSGTWPVGYFRSIKDKMKFDWDVALPPIGPKATPKTVIYPVFSGGWVIPKGCKDLKASWEALKFYSSKYFADNVMFSPLASLPTRKSAWAGAGFAQWPNNPPKSLTKDFYGTLLDNSQVDPSSFYDLSRAGNMQVARFNNEILNDQKPDVAKTMKDIAKNLNQIVPTLPWYKER